MAAALTIALAQIDPHVGDTDGNAARILAAHAEAKAKGADLVVFSELVVEGYTPEDMILKPTFQTMVSKTIERIAAATAEGPAILLGASHPLDGKLYNAAYLMEAGKVAAVSRKHELPNYGVFDEKRIFTPGPRPRPVEFKGVKLGIMICEDMWAEEAARNLKEDGAQLLIVLNGSPYEVRKAEMRLHHARARVAATGLPLLYVNQVGGQDETVYDGASFALDARRELIAQMPAFEAALEVVRVDCADGACRPQPGVVTPYPDSMEAIYLAMVTGLRDYVTKNRFPGVVIGLSGGLDSALTAAVAVDALGADKVRCVMMPFEFTSQASLEDAAGCAKLLGVHYDIVPIARPVAAFTEILAPLFEGRSADTTEENIQARSRAITLMAISNKFGHMVLTTGNKSEMSVGYATLYGDMCGGYSVLKDVYKTTVTRLSVWRNAHKPAQCLGPDGPVMPRNVITKPPTAELRANQTDEESLMPYEHLDDILHCLIEEEMGAEAIIERGHAPEDVRRVEHLLYVAEYKRRQAPPGVKITSKSFGRDRRYPITNGFRDAE